MATPTEAWCLHQEKRELDRHLTSAGWVALNGLITSLVFICKGLTTFHFSFCLLKIFVNEKYYYDNLQWYLSILLQIWDGKGPDTHLPVVYEAVILTFRLSDELSWSHSASSQFTLWMIMDLEDLLFAWLMLLHSQDSAHQQNIFNCFILHQLSLEFRLLSHLTVLIILENLNKLIF